MRGLDQKLGPSSGEDVDSRVDFASPGSNDASFGSLADSRILIVDDEPGNVQLLQRILVREGYGRVTGLSNPREAMAVIDEDRLDVVLLDLHMPVVDGYQILESIMTSLDPARRTLPVIVLTADATPEARRRALTSGAADFITKPFDVVEVALRIRNTLERQQLHSEVRRQNELLEDRVRARTMELERAQLETFERLALAAEYRDDDTGKHTRRVGGVARAIAEQLGMAATELDLLERAAGLHDVGKIGVPDGILLKPDRLTPEEFEVVKTHTVIGARILSGSHSPLLQLGEIIAGSHHERWDGRGYHGLAGEDIPLHARITTLADAFDAMTTDRPYRAARSREEAAEEVRRERGGQFDPNVVDVFLGLGIDSVRHAASAVDG